MRYFDKRVGIIALDLVLSTLKMLYTVFRCSSKWQQVTPSGTRWNQAYLLHKKVPVSGN